MTEWRIEPDEWPAAVADVGGPQLVVAGPGTGKTEFLVRRAVHLIDKLQVPADRLLMLAFSRRAAADLRRRVEAALGRSTVAIPASTFHSLAMRLLERWSGPVLGWPTMPALLTGPEQTALVRDLLRRERREDWPAAYRPVLDTHTFAREVTDFLLRAQEHLLDAAGLAEHADGRDDWRALPGFLDRYLAALAERRRLDYGTLIATAVRVLDDPGVQTEVARQYAYLLVDEYQDTTAAQAALLDRLSTEHRNLTVAADPYQSVYSFRGTELRNVAEFPERFRDAGGRPARRLVLASSFRVAQAILDAAELVATAGDLPGAAGPVTAASHSGRVDAVLFDQQSHEAEWIAAEVERLHLEDRLPFREMAVLVRTKRRLLPELSRALTRRQIPHDAPDARLVDHPAVRIVVDCVVAASHENALDVAEATRRLLLGPLFATTLAGERELQRQRLREHLTWPDLFRHTVPDGEPLANLLDDPAWATDIPADQGFWRLWTSLPQFGDVVHAPDRQDFRSAWSSLAQALARYVERNPRSTLVDWVRLSEAEEFEAIPLLSFQEPGRDRLVLTTLHQAKGLEFAVVIIADAVDGVFPDLRRGVSLLQPRLLSPSHSAEPAQRARFQLQEEMRLAYTAMTRASRRVIWTATTAGFEEGETRPSRFMLLAMGAEAVEDLPTAGLDDRRPVTSREAEAYLRRLLTDPGAPPPRRLAALTALVDGDRHGLRHPSQFAGMRRRGPDTGLLPDKLTLSPSQAESYAGCPRRYALERRLKIGDVPRVHAAMGTLIHEVLERTEGEAMQAGHTRGDIETALSHFEELFRPEQFGGGPWGEAWHRRGRDMLERLYAMWPTGGRVVAVEHPLRLEVEGQPWMGRVDRVETDAPGELRIVDYKTTKNPPSKDDAAASLQLGFYVLAARSDAKLAAEGWASAAEFWYPAKGTKTQLTTRALDPERLPEIEEALLAIGRQIQAENWRPQLNEHCDRCGVRIVCPLWPEGREAYIR